MSNPKYLKSFTTTDDLIEIVARKTERKDYIISEVLKSVTELIGEKILHSPATHITIPNLGTLSSDLVNFKKLTNKIFHHYKSISAEDVLYTKTIRENFRQKIKILERGEKIVNLEHKKTHTTKYIRCKLNRMKVKSGVYSKGVRFNKGLNFQEAEDFQNKIANERNNKNK